MSDSMNAPTIENVIYVGVDGSDVSRAAARWAAAEAHLRRSTLCLTHGYTLPLAGAAGAVVYPSEIFDADREWLSAMLAQTRTDLLTEFPELEVRLLLRYDYPVQLLMDVSAHALMTVVGSHGTHHFVESLLGSVALGATVHSEGPVVVVRNDPATNTVRGSGPVLVGLDGMTGSEEALAFAFEEASLRGVHLVAVHSWDDTPLARYEWAVPIAVDRAAIDDEERRLLAEQLTGWAGKYPDVVVESIVLRGPATRTLLSYCASAGDGKHALPSLLVVGSRGRGGLTGMLLGSTSQTVIAHAPCPVIVVRGQHGGRRG